MRLPPDLKQLAANQAPLAGPVTPPGFAPPLPHPQSQLIEQLRQPVPHQMVFMPQYPMPMPFPAAHGVPVMTPTGPACYGQLLPSPPVSPDAVYQGPAQTDNLAKFRLATLSDSALREGQSAGPTMLAPPTQASPVQNPGVSPTTARLHEYSAQVRFVHEQQKQGHYLQVPQSQPMPLQLSQPQLHHPPMPAPVHQEQMASYTSYRPNVSCGSSALPAAPASHAVATPDAAANPTAFFSSPSASSAGALSPTISHSSSDAEVSSPSSTPLVAHQVQKLSSRVVCKTCGGTFANKASLRRHTRAQHATDIDVRMPYKCDVCTRRFAMKSNMDRHRWLVHGFRRSNGRPQSCSLCSREFANRRGLNCHMRMLHDTGASGDEN